MVIQESEQVNISHVIDQVNDMDKNIEKMTTLQEALKLRVEGLEEHEYGGKAILTADEASYYLGITKNSLYKMVQKKMIPYRKPNGKMIFFLMHELIAWVESNGTYKVKDM